MLQRSLLAGGIHGGLQGIVVSHVGARVSIPGCMPIAMRGGGGIAGCLIVSPAIIAASTQNPAITERVINRRKGIADPRTQRANSNNHYYRDKGNDDSIFNQPLSSVSFGRRKK